MKEVYDEIRQAWVKASPEEVIRQLWLKKMVCHLGYPKQTIVVEKELKLLPHLSSHSSLPKRRLDILCFSLTREKESIFPVLLIECKAGPLTDKALWQVEGYNSYVKAGCVAIVNENEIRFLYQGDTGERRELSYLPDYSFVEEVC